jgi:geranylgeranyl diphosphate synthase type II
MNEKLNQGIKSCTVKTDKFFQDIYSVTDKDYSLISEAQTYSLLAGGKRVRPFIVNEVCRMFGGNQEHALTLGAALEMVHTFSLIHDDLPCMDNDVLRRGRNTCHVEFDEATALLAGDALSINAFEVIAASTLSDKDKVRATLALSRMSGWNGMIAGQIIDLAGEKKALGYNTLIKLHTLKTGCLIRCAAMLGCIAANVPDDDERYTDAISYAEKIGLAFQIIDDVLDKIGDASILGKTVGKDENSQKTTFLSFMSVNDAIEMAKRLTNEAISVIQKYDNSDLLIELANYLLTRNR